MSHSGDSAEQNSGLNDCGRMETVLRWGLCQDREGTKIQCGQIQLHIQCSTDTALHNVHFLPILGSRHFRQVVCGLLYLK